VDHVGAFGAQARTVGELADPMIVFDTPQQSWLAR
jgi:hypothetical protein